MKKTVRAFLLLNVLFLQFVVAQNISVTSFQLLENDLTAMTQGTSEIDQNGDVAALIKIVSPETGFTFDIGSLGVVRAVQKTGEWWVYVPKHAQRITIGHPKLGMLRNYYFPIPIQEARTYEMVLATGTVRTIVEDEHPMQFLLMQVEPKNATVYIDDKLQSLGPDGTLSVLLDFGKHSYRVEAASCVTEAGVVTIGKERQTLEIKLKSSRGFVQLECPQEKAEIYLNDKLMGVGQWSGNLDAGAYIAEVREAGHRNRSISFTLAERDTVIRTLPVPQPIYGDLQVNSTPVNAEVYVDGERVGQTPLFLNKMLAREHDLEIRLQDYQTYTEHVLVEEGKRTEVRATLSNVVQAVIHSKPEGVKLFIDGEDKGQTPFSGELLAGDYMIKMNLEGYEPYARRVHLSAAKPEITLSLSKIMMTSNELYAEAFYQMGGVNGIGGSLGGYFKNINLEFSFASSIATPQIIYWSTVPESETIQQPVPYIYKPSTLLAFKAGYGLRFGNRIRFVLQPGMDILSIRGDGQGQTQKTFVAMGSVTAKGEFSPFRHVALFVAPEWVFPMKKGDTATRIGDVSPAIARWSSGLYLRMGLQVYF